MLRGYLLLRVRVMTCASILGLASGGILRLRPRTRVGVDCFCLIMRLIRRVSILYGANSTVGLTPFRRGACFLSCLPVILSGS